MKRGGSGNLFLVSSKRNLLVFAFFLMIFLLVFASASPILDQLHLNLQTTDSSGNVAAGTYNFVFNISTSSNCLPSNVVYSKSATLTTDSRGIISYYLNNTGLNYSQQYYLCYYRNGALIQTSSISRTPYSFNAQNVSLSGVNVNTNLNLSGYNSTANYYFGSGKYLTDLNASAINSSQINYWLKNGNDLYYNNGNVGIGITTPDTPLEISTTHPNNLLKLKDATNGNYFVYRLSSDGRLILDTFDNSTSTHTYPISINPNSIGSNLLYLVNNSVGIGTTSPTDSLQVEKSTSGVATIGTIFSGGQFTEIRAGNTGSSFGFSNTGNFNIGTITSLNQNSLTNSIMTFTPSGNVGIGSASPSYKLDVNGNINVANTSAYLYDGQQALKLAKGTDSNYADTFVGANSGQSTATRQTAVGYNAGNLNTGDRQVAIGYNTGYSNTGGHQTAVGYQAGFNNIGIDQSVFGYAAGYDNTGNYTTGVGQYAIRGNTGNDVVALGYEAGYNNNVSNQFIVKQADVNSVPLIQGDFATGNVGVGTTTPGYKLDVNGAINAQNILVNGSAIAAGANLSGSGTTNYLAKFTGSSVLGNSGIYENGSNIGIGTTNPSYPLDVNGNLGIQDTIYDSNNGYTSLALKNGIYLNAKTGNPIAFEIGGNEYMRVASNGNVGIGTTSPDKLLSVNGSGGNAAIKIESSTNAGGQVIFKNTLSQYDVGISGATTGDFLIYDGNASQYIQRYTGSNGYQAFYTAGQDRLHISNSGNVGVGTTSPNAKLDVNGTVHSNNINVTSSGVNVFTQNGALVISG